jgi:serine/threonine-protein kinase
MSFNVGDRVGDYEILAVLGAGGMGKVYKVRNVLSDRVEAMKILLPNLESDPDLADRFLREIKVQASLVHPNIAALHTAQRAGNQILMLMEFVEGTTLEALLKLGRLPANDAIRYTTEVLDALSYAHMQGVVHRDIKPSNMMLTPEGHVKLMDFGIARATADKRLTQTGHTVGSLFYMSPEQIKGGMLDVRSDLYSLGVSLYELVTGQRPFAGDSDYSIMAAHLQQNPVPPIELDPTVPMALNEIILMSIAKDPEQRFQSAQAFRSALGNVGEMMGVPTTASPIQPATAATLPMPPPAPVPTPAVAPAPNAPRSRRALYMVVGSVATLAVLALALTQGPKFFGTKAETQQTQQQSPQQPSQQPETQQPAAQQPAGTPPTTPATSATAQETAKPSAESTAASQTIPATQPQVSTSRQTPATVRQSPVVERPQQAAQQTSPREEPARVRQESPRQEPPRQEPPRQEPRAAQQTTQPPAQPMNELRENYNNLALRAGAVKNALQQLEQQMARQGLGLRSDAVEARSRFDYNMQEAMSSIRGGDVENAKTYLQRAQYALDAMAKVVGQ